jgi:hypothetical protein
VTVLRVTELLLRASGSQYVGFLLMFGDKLEHVMGLLLS